MTTFKPRLLAAMRQGDMTPADLHYWFSRNHATVRYWVYEAKDDYDPLGRGPKGRLTLRRLKLLEWAIRHKIGFPIPESLSHRARPQHLKDTLHALDARVSESDLAK